jgi:hypothetical protein
MGLPTIAVPEYTLTIPSTKKEVKYRPFLVKEEKILLLAMESEKTEEIINATKTIIENCVYGDINVEEMPTFDIEYIFLQLRAKAKGEVLDLKYKCPKCELEIPIAINIDDITVQRNKEHTKDIKLTEELSVMMKYPNLSLQTKIAQTTGDKSEIEGLFETMIACIDYIYDKETTYPSKDHTEKEMVDFLESLTDTQFQKMSKFFETSPALKHNVELHCKNKVKGKGKEKKECGYKEKITLEGLNSFFA